MRWAPTGRLELRPRARVEARARHFNHRGSVSWPERTFANANRTSPPHKANGRWRRAPARPAVHRYHPHAGDGRGAKGQLRPSRHPHGAGARGLHAVAGGAALRLRRSEMAEPRPLRAVERPCLDAALCAAASGAGARSGRGRPPGRQPRRHPAVSSARQPLPGASGVRSHPGRRDHDRPARPGLRQQRRHGDRRAFPGQPVQSAGFSAVRFQRLYILQRRRPDGRRGQRSGLARRPPAAIQPVLDLRQQPHHHRWRHRHHVHRERRRALSRLPLERRARRRRQRLPRRSPKRLCSFAAPATGRH